MRPLKPPHPAAAALGNLLFLDLSHNLLADSKGVVFSLPETLRFVNIKGNPVCQSPGAPV